MKERGIDLTVQKSKGLDDLPNVTWDYVVTMGCGDACPFVNARNRDDWNIPDPRDMDEAEFRKVRDLIESKVKELLQKIL